MDFLRRFVAGIGQVWQRLSASARVNIVVTALATLTLIAAIVFMSSRPQYVRLYSNLDLDDASAIQSYLTEEGTPFKAQEGGTTILVPVEDRSRLRVALMDKGIPRKQGAAPGFELFQEQDLMANRWLQDVKYMRAIQGELQRQLNEFEFVRKSFVFIREANEELFVSEQKPSEAAVTLDVTRPLTKSEIKTILGIISSFGGANLSPANITLTTTDGTPLHVPPTSEFASIANSKLEYIAELEKQREDRALHGLKELGVRALVKVSAVVDFSRRTITSKEALPGTEVSEYEQTSTTSTKESLPEGAPGAMANLPVPRTEGAAETTEQVEETITNYQPSSTDTETVTEPGEVKQYIVSAIVEGEYKPAKDESGNAMMDADGQPVTEYVGLTPDRVKVYEDYLRAAVGEGQTPTVITVNDHPFDIGQVAAAREAVEATQAASLREMMLQYGGNAAKLLLIAFCFLLVRRFFRRSLVFEPMEAKEVPASEMPHASPEDLRRQEVAQEVERLATEQPDTVAALLRSWMAEDQE